MKIKTKEQYDKRFKRKDRSRYKIRSLKRRVK